MTEDRRKNSVGVARINGERGNSPSVAKSQMRPGLACIRGFVNSITHGEIGARQSFATRYVDNVWIGRSHGDSADRLRGLRIKDGRPRPAKIVGFPHTTIDRAHVENIRLAGHSANGASPPAASRPDHAPAHLLVRTFRILLSLAIPRAEKKAQNHKCNHQEAIPSHHMTPRGKCPNAQQQSKCQRRASVLQILIRT